MFERFTERARRVVFWARYFAGQAGGSEIKAEHLLLGLLKEDMGLARRFLGSPWALEEVWRRIEKEGVIREESRAAGDLPLDNASKRVLAYAAEEAYGLLSKSIGTGHLMLGLLREERSLAAEILRARVVLTSAREELARVPHHDSIREEFIREQVSLPEPVIEVQTRIRSIRSGTNNAIANRDFDKARAYATEERKERERLFLLCQEYGLTEWLFE